MEVIFLDNGLISKGEHSYALAAKLAEALSRRNLRYRMFGVQSLDRSIVEELGASPHFKRSLYDGEDLSRDEQRLRAIAAIFRGARARARSGPNGKPGPRSIIHSRKTSGLCLTACGNPIIS